MDTQEYVRYAKYGTVVFFGMFVVGAVGEIAGHAVLSELPAPFGTLFVYLLGFGLAGFFVSAMAGGVIPLALE
ncbi:hypothetical protein EGH25_11510 [Haladaptatus sp. F3-133]|jgi:hypothetical protein|uniref:Uncharacterized protein n=1 Tax=Halorutilus salinus TaxID=2487751 RepID=A0A9Q4C820_9EURY|nr:hypothetical protein [Halorutilus salinus]MCX2819976.1 hypothetical protein [Halorutilus salinus]